jgi:hypothetical protein
METEMLSIVLALLAAPPEPAPSPEITVIAPELTPAEVDRLTRAYVDSVLPTPVAGQFFRWQQPVCIKYTGLNPAFGPRVTARIAAVAATAGVTMGAANCRPNVLIAFTADARETVNQIVTKQPDSFGDLSLPERKVLRESAMPVRWWYGTCTSKGRRPSKAAADGSKLPCDVTNVSPDTYVQPSLIATSTTVSVAGAVIIVDVPLAEGTSLDALADYVALVTLVPTRIPPKSPGVPSILNLFATPPGDGRPRGLSDWDRQLLSGFYQSHVNRDASVQRRSIIKEVKEAAQP